MVFTGQEYVVYCANASDRNHILRTSSDVLKRASDNGFLRLETSTDVAAARSNSSPGSALPTFAPPLIDIPRMQACLRTSSLGRVAVYADAAPSTQDALRGTFRGLPQGTVAIAASQTEGRGRRGSEWVSPRGSASFSMLLVLPMSSPERLTFVQYVAALAAVDCVKRRPGWDGIPLRIKWPNDLYVGPDKIGGILCEASTQGTHFDVVVGVGVNVCNTEPTACLEGARCMHSNDGIDSSDCAISCEEFMAEYFTSFEALFLEFSRQTGFDGLLGRYLQAWLHSGQRVRLEAYAGRIAIVEGLASNGHVRVRCADNGQVIDMSPDVTSLDVNECVMREKVVGSRVAPAVP